MTSQDPAAAAKNRRFFAANASYAGQVSALDTYRNVRTALDGAVTGLRRVIDIGAGGVFDYDTSLVESVVAVDLCLEPAAAAALPPNVTPRQGDALALPEPDAAYDGAVIAFLFHHLVGRRAGDVVENVRRSLAEAHRVLRPGGRLVVAESCVPPWFYAVERVLFTPAALLARTPLVAHPVTLQLPLSLLLGLVRERFDVVRAEPIPMGRWVLQFGHRWPSALTPARAHLIVARR